MNAEQHGTVCGYNHHGCRCEDCRGAIRRRRAERKSGPKPAHVHGTPNGYTNWGCRCEECRRAHASIVMKQRHNRLGAEVPDHVHGTQNGYDNYTCRCDSCLAAHNAYRRVRYQAKESAAARGSTRGTICKWGHKLAGENLRIRKDGRKVCVTCARDRTRAFHARSASC